MGGRVLGGLIGAGALAGPLVFALGALAGCSDPCCTFDSQPITLERAPAGGLLALVSVDGAGPEKALVDTASPITLWNTPLTGDQPEVRRRDIRILGITETPGPCDGGVGTCPPTRAIFRGISTVGAPIGNIGTADAPLTPLTVLGGDLFSSFSVEIGFAAPELLLWSEQRATDQFLSENGYAVMRIARRGGGELEALAPRDGLGPRGPFQYPPSMLVVRACGAADSFDREAPPPARCCTGDERTLATGTDLALLVGTGHGRLVLAKSAWTRITRRLAAVPPTTPGLLMVATSLAPIAAEMSTLPRLAVVDREAESSVDPGPCVELGRARRLEQVAVRQARNPEVAACALPCDQDPRSEGRAQNSAGYLELAGDLPVAIIADGETLLQTLRAEVRPEGPELDGILGADVLRHARVELDYRNQPSRAIFSCETGSPTTACRAVGRCPRLPESNDTHVCFGLPRHGLPRMCDNQTACE
jgi:hypothetical protein